MPPQVAVILAEPAATPRTRPLGLTVATAVLSLAQLMVSPGSALPLASLGVAVNCCEALTKTLAEAGVTETEAIYEGLYVFAHDALGPQCGSVKLVLYSEKAPAKGDTRVVDLKVLQQIWQG